MNAESTYQLPTRRRRWPWVLLALVLAVVAGTQGYRLFLRSQIHRELALIRKEGFPTSPRELQEWRAEVPAKENAALLLWEAADSLSAGPADFGQDRWPSRTGELGPEERDRLADILTNNAPALEAVHAAAKLERCRFPVDYSRGPNTLLPHLAKIKSLAQLLRAEATLHMEEGRVQEAVDSVVAGVALARCLETEPLLISQLVRVACLAITTSSLERLLTLHELSEPQLAALTSAVQGARETSLKAYREGYIGELCSGIYCFQIKPAELLRVINPEAEVSTTAQLLFPLYAWTGLRDRDYLFYVRLMRQMLDAAKVPFPGGLEQMDQVGRNMEQQFAKHRLYIISKMLLPAITKYAQKAAESEARLLCTEAACAIETHRRAKGALPKDLPGALSPAAVQVLKDPFDGEPLRYEILRPGYVVYSVGPNGTDEGGLERELRREGGGRSGSNREYDVTFTVER